MCLHWYQGKTSDYHSSLLHCLLLTEPASHRRMESLKNLSYPNYKLAIEDAMVVYDYQQHEGSISRGRMKSSITHFPYQCFGIVANRNRPGVSYKKTPKSNPKSREKLEQRVRRAETLLLQYLPTELVCHFLQAKEVVGFPTMTTCQDSIFASVAFACDYQSSSHTDNDFFLSSLEVRVAKYSRLSMGNGDAQVADVTPNLDPNPPHAQAFVFPTVGVTVLLRPGDTLIFNPNIHHCCSQPFKDENAYESYQVQLTSFYLTSKIVGGNDNSVPLNRLQRHFSLCTAV